MLRSTVLVRLKSALRMPTPVALPEGAGPWLWAVAVLDMMAVAWMIAAGDWLDQTKGFLAVVTLGGHPWLVLIMAAVGFVMLAGLAVLTDGFTAASRLEIGLVTIACAISVIAVAGALSTTRISMRG